MLIVLGFLFKVFKCFMQKIICDKMILNKGISKTVGIIIAIIIVIAVIAGVI